MTNNTALTLIENFANTKISVFDSSNSIIPISSVLGKGSLSKIKSFGGRTLSENAKLVDDAINNSISLNEVWNHSHSQWDWKHIVMSSYSDFHNMKQIEAEMAAKRQALTEAKWRQVKFEIDLKKWEEKLQDENLDYWKKIDIKYKIAKLKDEHMQNFGYIEGAMKDVLAINEIYEQLKQRLANFNENDHEKYESKSHLKRSVMQCIRDVRQAGFISKGEQEYLEQIGVNPSKMQNILRKYVEEEAKDSSWDTSGLINFVNSMVNDLIDNHKVDVVRMKLMGFDPNPTENINYDQKVALLEKK